MLPATKKYYTFHTQWHIIISWPYVDFGLCYWSDRTYALRPVGLHHSLRQTYATIRYPVTQWFLDIAPYMKNVTLEFDISEKLYNILVYEVLINTIDRLSCIIVPSALMSQQIHHMFLFPVFQYHCHQNNAIMKLASIVLQGCDFCW